VIAKRPIRQRVKLAGLHVCLELAIPVGRVKFHEPGAEGSSLFRRHPLNFRLDFFDSIINAFA
jgi:hypothetical protein